MSDARKKRHITTLAGSMRFFSQIMAVAEALSQKGEIVLVPFLDRRETIPLEDIVMHAEVQFQRIDMSDSLTVINPGNYIGASTEIEIAYAEKTRKQIRYLEPPVPEPEQKEVNDNMDPKTKSEIDAMVKSYQISRSDLEIDISTRRDCPGEFYLLPLMQFSTGDLEAYLASLDSPEAGT